MKRLSFLPLAIITLLAMAVLHATNASAKMYGGKIVLEIGETYTVEAVPTSYTASGSFTKSGTNFSIIATGSYSCKISAIRAGQGTLSYWGAVAPPNSWTTQTYDIYWDVEVKEAPICVTSISLNTTSVTMGIGETKQLTASVSPSNATNKSVSWSSDKTSVATVSSNGLVTAKATGNATITCKANDECGVKTTCIVTVTSNEFIAKTVEGVDVTYQIIDRENKTCAVGAYDAWGYPKVAINNETSGAITIPEIVNGYRVVEISEQAFYKCESITTVNLPSSVTDIKHNALYGCKSLTTVTGTENLEYIEYMAFYSYPDNPWYKQLPDGPLYIGKVLYGYKGTPKSQTTLGVKEGTTCICGNALRGFFDLTGLIIPKSVKYFGAVKHKSYVGGTPIGSNMTSIVVSPENETYDSRENCNAVIETKTNRLVGGCNTTVIPTSVKTIGCSAFSNCNWPTVVIPDWIEVIEKEAYGSHDLKYVYLGRGIKKIEEGGFGYSDHLKAIHVSQGTPISITGFSFPSQAYDNCTLFVPNGSKSKYASTSEWSRFKNIVEGEGHLEDEILLGNTIEGHRLYFKILSNEAKTCELVTPNNGIIYQFISGKVTIPQSVNGYTVVSIGEYAFYRQQITAVDIPNSVLSIGKYAFYYCEALETITGADNVETVDNSAFWSTSWFNNRSDYDDLYVGKVFYQCRSEMPVNTTIEVKSGTKNVHMSGFYYKSNLVGLVIPKSVSILDSHPCACYNLRRIVVEEGNETYDSRKDCNAIIEKQTNKLVIGCSGTVIPNTVKVIGSYAFYAGLNNGTTLVVPNSVVTIEDHAFYAPSSYIKVPTLIIGSGVKSIGTNVINSSVLVAIHSLIQEPFNLADGVFSNDIYAKVKLYVPIGTKAKYMAKDGWKNFVSITEIADNEMVEGETFTERTQGGCLLTYSILSKNDKTCEVVGCDKEATGEVVIPAEAKGYTVISIGNSAFSQCDHITKISMANTIKEIKSNGIYSCDKLTDVSLPTSIKVLGSSSLAFNPITSITIPKSVESMTGNPLVGDSCLTVLTVEEGNTVYESPAGSNAIINKKTNTLIAGCATTIIPSNVKTIGSSAFYYQKKLTSIAIPASVDSIMSSAFSNTGLTNIELPQSLRYLGSISLGYNRMTSVTIPKSVKGINGNPLIGDSCLTNIIVEEGNEVYESPAGCNAIIDKKSRILISGCSATVIPNSVKAIGYQAFQNQCKMTSVSIPNQVDSIAGYAFDGNLRLSRVTLPASLKHLANYAFYSTYDDYAINTVKSLNKEPIAIPDYVFNSATYEKGTLIVPVGTKALYESLDGWKKFKTIVEAGAAPTSIMLPSMVTVVAGERIAIEPTFVPENADAELTWTSDDETIAKVDVNGVVLGVRAGATFINVETDNGKVAWCKVTVTPNPSAITDIRGDSHVPSTIYTLSGQRITAPRKGINIVGGKKVIVK